MKKYYLFIALAMVAVMTISCKNNKKSTKTSEADAEVVEVAKTLLADDVLETVDELSKIYVDESCNYVSTDFMASCLSEVDKNVEPDYLLDPAQTSDFVTKSQKFAALAILSSERTIREVYGMPVGKTVEAMVRLAAELNYPLSYDEIKDLNTSERIRRFYEVCKESGELVYFWQLNAAFMTEYIYIVVNNPDVFLTYITDEQWSSFTKRYDSYLHTVRILAEYDEEMASVLNIINETSSVSSDEEASKAFATKESGIQKILEDKDKYIAHRNALLK